MHIYITYLAPQLFSKIHDFRSTSLEYDENMTNTQTEVTDDRVLHNMSKGGPQTRPNRPTKPRHRPSDIRIHQAAYQRRTVASGRKRGSADPTSQPFRLSFGGKLDPILPKAVLHVSMFRDGGNRPQALYKGPPTTLTTHTPLEGLSLTLSCDVYSLG